MYAAEKVNPVHLQLGNRNLLIGCKPYQTRKRAFWELDPFAVVRLFLESSLDRALVKAAAGSFDGTEVRRRFEARPA